MGEIFYMVKRNSLIFLRERSAVFFSLLSMLIVLALMVIFLGRMNSQSLVHMLSEYGGERDAAADERNAAYLIQLWTLAGILVVNAVTVTLTVTGAMVQDETEKRLMAFYVTPVSRLKLSLGYILAAWLVGTGMCLLTLAAGEIYFAVQGYGILGAGTLLTLTGMTGLNTFVFSAIAYLLALFVHNSSAWSGLLTIIGTLVGFAGGIYLPMDALSEQVQSVLKCLPVLHGAAMMRKVCTEEAVAETFLGLPEMAGDVFREAMGITVSAGKHAISEGYHTISVGEQVLLLLFYAIMAIGAAWVLSRRRKLK